MGRRLEVELTSIKDDGIWTWRAAGAKKPKGDIVASLLYDGAKVGDVVKVEADFHLDGIEITEVFAPKQKRERSDLLQLKTRPLRDDELVTTQRVAKNERRGGRGRRDRSDGRRDDKRRHEQKPEADRRPKPKRLRPKRVHREALLESVAEEHRPIVEQVIKDGMPGVRAAIEKQAAAATEAGKPAVDASPILAIAEKNLAKARLAEWRDRADAALADAAEIDIRDLRSVVVAGADVARQDDTRALVDQIKEILDTRLESDHAAWLEDLDNAVSEGRVVRGLRLSSRPVKAGAPLPTEVASKLAQQASEALAADVAQDRWATVLDALAFSPVRGAVTPVGTPAQPSDELLSEVRRLSDRVPTIAALFGIDPAEVPKSAKRRRSPRQNQRGGRTDASGNQAKPSKPRKPKVDRPHPGAEPKVDPATDPSSEKVEEPNAEAEEPGKTSDVVAEPVGTSVDSSAADEAAGSPTEPTEPTEDAVVATDAEQSVSAEASGDQDQVADASPTETPEATAPSEDIDDASANQDVPADPVADEQTVKALSPEIPEPASTSD